MLFYRYLIHTVITSLPEAISLLQSLRTPSGPFTSFSNSTILLPRSGCNKSEAISAKGSKTKAKIVVGIILIPALGLIFYSLYTIWGAIYLARSLTDFEFLSMIFGVWSLMVMVYVLPTIKGEYTPEIEQTGVSKAQQKAGDWKFSVWKGYKSYIRKDYGTVYEKEFERYGSRLFMIRTILSGLVLLPISLILVTITPLAILSIVLWIRMFSLDHKHFSGLERGLLILVTLSVALLTTIAFFQAELIVYSTFFDVSYGIGLLSGVILLFIIILRK